MGNFAAPGTTSGPGSRRRRVRAAKFQLPRPGELVGRTRQGPDSGGGANGVGHSPDLAVREREPAPASRQSEFIGIVRRKAETGTDVRIRTSALVTTPSLRAALAAAPSAELALLFPSRLRDDLGGFHRCLNPGDLVRSLAPPRGHGIWAGFLGRI